MAFAYGLRNAQQLPYQRGEARSRWGLRRTFGNSLDGILRQIANVRRVEVDAKLKEYGLKGINEMDRLTAAEEVLAEMAQTHPEIGFVKRAIAAVRTWLREHIPGFGKMVITDAEIIRSYILPARNFVERGAQSQSAAKSLAFSRGTKEAVTNPKDVVGKTQGGRSADDSTPGVRKFNTQSAFEKYGGIGDVDESTDIEAKSQTFADMAEAAGYTVAGRGDKYVVITKPFGKTDDGYNVEVAIKVRISDHSNINRGVHFGETDINIAPDDGYQRDTFEEALRKINSAYVDENFNTVIPNESTAPDSGGAPAFSRATTLADYTRQVTDKLNETFSHPGKLSLWDKTVGSMYHMAERNPPFKRVFTAAQNFISDVSFYATESADLAPKILPKLDTWKDMLKTPVSAIDNKAISAPILQGTLSWTRDASGKPVRVEDGDAKAGLVWSDAELQSMFKLNPAQIGLYREFRTATDKSLDNMAKAEMMRFGGKDVADVRDMVMEAKDAGEAGQLLHDYLMTLAGADLTRTDTLTDTANGMVTRGDRVASLKQQGYAPLSRFGRYSVDVVVKGKREYFGLFESARAANQMAAKLQNEFGAANVAQGTLSQKEFEQFQGITPESLELFGNMLGLDSTGDEAQDQAFQTYLKLSKSNRSAMKRMIHRQGTAGFSEDMGRVLAAFVYSNARQTSAALHMGDMGEAVNAIPKGQGELKDAAIELASYVKQPREEAQALRGLLFAQYLGGSVASAFVNFTQPLTVSFPYLSQFGGAAKSGAALIQAMKDQRAGAKLEPGLAQALHQAEEKGTVSPQSVHELMAQAQGRAALNSGDGTKTGDALALAKNNFAKLALGWGKLFGLAEQINRRSTFIAAYRMAEDQNIANPADFATKAVDETQFISNKANKAKFARGAVGSTLMTFKSYSVNYLELLHRMATQNGPEGKKASALMLGMLFLMAGAGGLPFADDLDDVVDFFAQRLGYNFSNKKAKQEFLQNLFGKGMADFIDRGISGLPGSPIDTSGRMSMGNLLPGTGLLLKKRDHTSDVQELFGPAGDLVKRGFQAGDQLLSGHAAKAVLTLAPKALYNAAKGADMASSGNYNDDKGYKVLPTTPFEAAMKAIGFQPASVAEVQQSNYLHQRAKDFYNQNAQDIRAAWAKGIYEKNQEQIAEAIQTLKTWNEKNPDQRISANLPAILRKAHQMALSKDERIDRTAPKAMRAQMRRESAEIRDSGQ